VSVLGVRASALWVVVTALALLIVGCSPAEKTSPGGRESSARSVPKTSPSVSLSEIAGERASAAYVGMWRDMVAAARTSDWKSPVLARYATGEALSVISRSVYTDYRNGLITKGVPKNSPRVIAVTPETDPSTVMISDCGDSTHWLKYRKETGELADDEPGGRQAITAEVKRYAGGWKVSRFAVEAVGSC